MNPFVSVIIPIYKVEVYLPNCIESCLGQTLRNIEIILINDGSPDNCAMIIDKYAAVDARIVAIHKQNEGVSIARKTGLESAIGEYIFYLDGDDYLPTDALEFLYLAARKNKADFVVGDFIIEYPDGNKQDRKFFDFKEVGNIDFLRYCFGKGDFYFTGRLIHRKFIVESDLNIPAEITFGEDNVAIVQIAHKLHKAIKVNHPILYYVQRERSVTNILKKSDLIERANACNFIIEYAYNNGFYKKIKQEIELFALREIYGGIVRGYVDNALAYKYLKLPFNSDSYLKKNLGIKMRLILTFVSINMNYTLMFIQFMKSIQH